LGGSNLFRLPEGNPKIKREQGPRKRDTIINKKRIYKHWDNKWVTDPCKKMYAGLEKYMATKTYHLRIEHGHRMAIQSRMSKTKIITIHFKKYNNKLQKTAMPSHKHLQKRNCCSTNLWSMRHSDLLEIKEQGATNLAAKCKVPGLKEGPDRTWKNAKV